MTMLSPMGGSGSCRFELRVTSLPQPSHDVITIAPILWGYSSFLMLKCQGLKADIKLLPFVSGDLHSKVFATKPQGMFRANLGFLSILFINVYLSTSL